MRFLRCAPVHLRRPTPWMQVASPPPRGAPWISGLDTTHRVPEFAAGTERHALPAPEERLETTVEPFDEPQPPPDDIVALTPSTSEPAGSRTAEPPAEPRRPAVDLEALAAQLRSIERHAREEIAARAVQIGVELARRALGEAPPVSATTLETWVREALDAYPSRGVVLAVSPEGETALREAALAAGLDLLVDPAISDGSCELRYPSGTTIFLGAHERLDLLADHLETAA